MKYEWFLSDGNERIDSVFLTKTQFASMVEGGGLDDYSIVWREGYYEWVDIKYIKDKIELSSKHRYHDYKTIKYNEGINILDSDQRPWTRYYARVIDSLFLGLMAGVIFMWLRVSSPDSILLYILAWPIIVVYETIVIGIFGTTVGKKIMGVRVCDGYGNPVGIDRSLKRSLSVWVSGFWLGIPIICIYPMDKAEGHINKYKISKWDKKLGLHVEHTGRVWVRHIVFWIIVVSYASLSVVWSGNI
tara:strand:+ start:28 stop:762 length:735 start_codon:yes stop_codon:yes gene_type:complete